MFDISSKLDNIVSCNICSKKTCNNPNCIIWIPDSDHWECADCHQFNSIAYVQKYSWIFERLNQKFNAKPTISSTNFIKTDSDSEQRLILNGMTHSLSYQ